VKVRVGVYVGVKVLVWVLVGVEVPFRQAPNESSKSGIEQLVGSVIRLKTAVVTPGELALPV